MNGFLKISGDYSDWNVYRKAVIICDVTEIFIGRAFAVKTRTTDQMRQAARSCKQNIIEGISDNTVSKAMCLKLIGVARGSVRELLEDYLDFLRQNQLSIWAVNDPRTIATRHYCRTHDEPADFAQKCRMRSDETVANIMITQIHQMDALLAMLLKKLEEDFLNEGGIKESMTRARLENRNKNKN